MSVFREIYEKVVQASEFKTYQDNTLTKMVTEDSYESAIVNSFKWDGAAKDGEIVGFEQQRPENYLYYRGLCGGFKENGTDYIYPAFPVGTLRPDGYYTRYALITMDGHPYYKDFEELVLLKNNPSIIPSHTIVKYYCERLEEVLRTIDNMLYRARWGNIFEGNALAKALLEKLKEKVDEGHRIICVEGEGSLKQINRVNLFDNRESDIVSMWAIFEKYKNELLTTFGFNNVGYEKHERLLVDEVTANNDVILNGFFGSMVDCRKDFCERYNKRFDSQLTCEVNRQTVTTNKDNMQGQETEEETPPQQEGGEE